MKKTLKRLLTLAFCATIIASMSLSASAASDIPNNAIYYAESTSPVETLNVLAYSSSSISNGTDVTTWRESINMPDTQVFVMNPSSYGGAHVLTAKGNPTYVVSYNRVSYIPEMWTISADNQEEEYAIFYAPSSSSGLYLYFDKVNGDPCLKLTNSLLYENGVAMGHRLTTVSLSTLAGARWTREMFLP